VAERYNRLAPRLGGIQVAAGLDSDGGCVLRDLRIGPTVRTIYATLAPWLVLMTFAQLYAGEAARAVFGKTGCAVALALDAGVVQLWLEPLWRIIVVTVALRWCGGLRLTVEPEEREGTLA
jgi:hypothetical protein